MITGIAVPANNRLQRTEMDKVPKHVRQRAAAESGRSTTHGFLLSTLVSLIALLVVGVARGDPAKEADRVLAQLGVAIVESSGAVTIGGARIAERITWVVNRTAAGWRIAAVRIMAFERTRA